MTTEENGSPDPDREADDDVDVETEETDSSWSSDETADSETTTDSDRDPSTTRRRLWPKVAAFALAAVTCVAAIVAVAERGRANDAHADLDNRSDARLAAAGFAEAYLSYDYTDVEASQARLNELATESWLDDFEATRLQEVDDLFSNIESRTVADTTAVYLGDVSDVTATALVVVDVDATSAATGDQSLTDLTFLVDLVRVDGVWRVDRVAPPPQANVGGALPPPADGDVTDETSTPSESTAPESTGPG